MGFFRNFRQRKAGADASPPSKRYNLYDAQVCINVYPESDSGVYSRNKYSELQSDQWKLNSDEKFLRVVPLILPRGVGNTSMKKNIIYESADQIKKSIMKDNIIYESTARARKNTLYQSSSDLVSDSLYPSSDARTRKNVLYETQQPIVVPLQPNPLYEESDSHYAKNPIYGVVEHKQNNEDLKILTSRSRVYINLAADDSWSPSDDMRPMLIANFISQNTLDYALKVVTLHGRRRRLRIRVVGDFSGRGTAMKGRSINSSFAARLSASLHIAKIDAEVVGNVNVMGSGKNQLIMYYWEGGRQLAGSPSVGDEPWRDTCYDVLSSILIAARQSISNPHDFEIANEAVSKMINGVSESNDSKEAASKINAIKFYGKNFSVLEAFKDELTKLNKFLLGLNF